MTPLRALVMMLVFVGASAQGNVTNSSSTAAPATNGTATNGTVSTTASAGSGAPAPAAAASAASRSSGLMTPLRALVMMLVFVGASAQGNVSNSSSTAAPATNGTATNG